MVTALVAVLDLMGDFLAMRNIVSLSTTSRDARGVFSEILRLETRYLAFAREERSQLVDAEPVPFWITGVCFA